MLLYYLFERGVISHVSYFHP